MKTAANIVDILLEDDDLEDYWAIAATGLSWEFRPLGNLDPPCGAYTLNFFLHDLGVQGLITFDLQPGLVIYGENSFSMWWEIKAHNIPAIFHSTRTISGHEYVYGKWLGIDETKRRFEEWVTKYLRPIAKRGACWQNVDTSIVSLVNRWRETSE